MKLAKLLLVAALAAGAAAAQAGMGILWSTGGGWVVAAGGDPDSGPGVAASDDVTWQLVYAGPDGVANAVDLSAANWTGGDDVLLAVRSIPAGGGTAADGTSWDAWLMQRDGDATYVDLAWPTDRGGYVFQRIFQGTPSEGTPYAESGLFAFNPAFVAEPGAMPDNFSFPEDGNGLVLDRTIPTTLKTYPLWVGGTQVTSANATNILGDGTASFESSASGGTLFLSNATITATSVHPVIDVTANIFSDSGFDLTISLAGSNRVENAASGNTDSGVYARANLAITGGGTLVAEMTGQYGIFAYDNLRIDGATVTVSAGDTGLSFGNMLAISNATVTATGTSSHGIYCSGTNGRIDIADSVVTATGGTQGLYARGTGSSLAVSGASVVTAVTTSDDDVAFSAAALVLGDGLAVTEPAGGVFGEDGWGSGCVIDPATGAPAKRVVIAAPPAVFPLWVGGVQVCETNQNDILGDGTASFAGSASGGTLSLSNATITATHQFEDEWSSGSNTATVFSGEGFDLTISLAGSNILQNADHPLISDQGHGYGVRSQGNLAITGGGALVAWVEYNGAGIDTDGNLLIDEAVVTAHSGQDGIRVGGSLAISNAVVTAYGVDYGGISGGDGDIDIADSVVTATGWAGIEADGHTVAVSGASVVTAEATWGDESAWALCASALVLGDGLAISEPAGGVFGENEWGAKCVLDPATGKAALRVVIAPVEFYPLWVGGVQVCTTNRTDILGDGTASFVPSASGGTLSLSNATITATSVHPVIDVTANIFSDSGFDLTISLAGSNRVECGEIAGNLGFCVCARANLAISGEGTLVAEMIGGYTKGIVTYGNLRIDGATVTASAGDTGLRFGGTLVISNATVTATGTSSSYGIYCSRTNGRIDIADSVVTATGCSGGLVAPAGTIAISGASVVTAVATNDNESGIYTKTLVPSDGLAITEPAGGTFSGDPSSNWNAVIDPATGKAALRVVIDRRFAVTVEGGTPTNTTARAGETVTVVANAPEEGKAFVEWSPDDVNDVSFARADAATTTFTMPERAVTVTAVFKEIQIASIPDQEWTGSAVEPAFKVYLDGVDQALQPGSDYTVFFTNNVDPGTATATVAMAPPRTGRASATFTILPPPEPPAVSNVVARQRWPWNGLVDVDYEVGGDTNLLAGVTARITFEERIEGGTGRIWVASNFLAGAEPSVEPGPHRATWDTAADGLTDVVAEVKATVNLVGTGNEKGLELVNKTVIVTPVDPASEPSCVVVNGNGYLLTNDPKGIPIDLRFGSGLDSAKLGDVVGITLDPEKVKDYFDSPDSLQFVPSEGVKLVDPTTGDKVDSLEVSAYGSVTLFVTADQVVPGGSITVHGNGKTVVIDNINFYDSVPEGWVGVVVTSAASAEFRLDTREGPLPSDGTEMLTYSTLWHPAGDAAVTILQDGEEEPVAAELAGEGDIVWQVFEDGTYTLTHKTMAGDATVSAEETATFVVTGHPPVEAALRWKYAKNANGWHCAQIALKWHPSYADEISDMRLLFADRYEGSEPLAVIKTLDEAQTNFFLVSGMIKMAGNDWKYYFLNDENGKVYSERFLESGYREKLDERPTVIDGDEAGTLTSWSYSDSTRYITNGVLNADGTSFSDDITVNGRTVTLKFASKPHGLGRRTAYLVDPATVVDPLGSMETYRDVEYRVAPIDLDGFSDLGAGDRAVYGVSDETMASPLASVPKSERKICLRVVNRDYSTVGWVDNKLAILAWNVGGSPRFLPIAETMSSLRDGDDDPLPAPQPAPRPLSVAEANLSASFGLAPAAVARGAVTCRVSSMSFGEDGGVEGTFAVAAENAGGVVAESGELADNVKLTVLGAERLGGAFEPLDPAAFGVELLSRRPPYAFRVKAPGDNAFFKVRLEADNVFE